MTREPPAPRADRASASSFRELLRRAGYTRGGIQNLLGGTGDVLARAGQRPVYLRRIAQRGAGPNEGGSDPESLLTIVRLFLLDEPVDPAEAERALAPTPIRALEDLGVVAQTAGVLRGTVRVVPHGEVVIASDLPGRDDVQEEHVAGIHRPSITLADLTVRRPVRTALDVGTGNGIQAILASRHAERVVATDINERALAFAALNAALNEIENIEFRAGSFFEPVAGETFDLVVCNPPYVISPESAFLFRDSGLGRDRVSEQLVGELPAHLEEGAFGTIMVSWIQSGPDTGARPGAWLAGRGCDAWVLHTAVEDPLTTAAGWNRDLASDEGRYSEGIDRWLAYFEAERIEALAYGAIVLRRRDAGAAIGPMGANWIRSKELPNEPRTNPEAHLLRLFTGVDASIARPTDAALASVRLALAPGAMITTHLRLGESGWAEAADLTLEQGIPFSAELDRFTAELMTGLDGTRSLGEVLDAFAAQHDAPPERVRASGLGVARQMLELGFAAPSRAVSGDSQA